MRPGAFYGLQLSSLTHAEIRNEVVVVVVVVVLIESCEEKCHFFRPKMNK